EQVYERPMPIGRSSKVRQRPIEATAWIGPPSLWAEVDADPWAENPWPGTVQLFVDWPSAYPASPEPSEMLRPLGSRRVSAEMRSRRSPVLCAESVTLSPLTATDQATVGLFLLAAPKKTGIE